MIEIISPDPHDHLPNIKKVFVGGSIEMGKARDWQAMLSEIVAPFDIVLLNPRRKQWDSTWEQSINNPVFFEQVTWELDGINDADLCIFHFEPGTFSPITLMEFGYVAAKPDKKCVVSCPDGFWRKGNVEIMAQREGIILYNSLTDLLLAFKTTIELNNANFSRS